MTRQHCIEPVPHFQKGQASKNEQCKRYAIEGSQRCALHSKTFKPAKDTTAPQEQSSIR